MVKPIRDYHNTRPKQDAKPDKKHKKPSTKDTAGSASSKPSTALATLANTCSSAAASEPSTGGTAESTAPAILKSTILGINAITKALERSIQDLAAHPPPTAIILCKGDLIPSHLYAHLGPMIAMLPGVLLFPLLRGSERRLSEALGLPAVGALAIKSTEGSREAEDLIMILKGMVEPMTASWLPKVTPKSLAKDKTSKQPTATKKSATTSEAGAGIVSSAVSAPVSTSGHTTEAPKPAAQQADFITTNIKTIKTTMPIVVKTPKPTQTDNSKTNNNNNNDNKGKGQGQQQQQQKQKQQQNQSQSHNQNPKQKQQQQVNQGKNKKPPVEGLDGHRGQVKKAKSN